LTVTVPGRAAHTAPLQSLNGLPEAADAADAGALGAQGKPTTARPPVARPPSPPRRATLTVTVAETDPVVPVFLELYTCLKVGRPCPFDAIVATSAGTFVAPAAVLTGFGPTVVNGARAVTCTFTTAALSRR
jgi:uncharacterized membrane protein YphA (DoxX/SURF4 family)